jgi:amidase
MRALLCSMMFCSTAMAAGPSTVTQAAPPASPIEEKSVVALARDLASGKISSEALTRAYMARIAALDAAGPALHSVIAINPRALDEARRSDRDRAAGRSRGPLDGIPVLIKDNIESDDGTPTTAGSAALAANVTHRDAPLVMRLKRAGAVILGKTNLSEWANMRSSNSISGWSAVGGLVKNPYALDRTACGSSSGTGAAIAASLAAVGVGTETDGSVTCPASVNGLVGLKPTLGLVSRTYVVPISHNQDTPGPLGRSVADVAALLNVIAGSDPADAATQSADAHKRDYAAALATASLRGKRLGVLRYAAAFASPAVTAEFNGALAVLRARGARLVEIRDFKPNPALSDAENQTLLTDFKTDLNAYLASTPASVKTRTLANLIAFDRADPRELGLFGHDLFEKAQATRGPADPLYRRARTTCRRFAGPDGIDRLMSRYRLDALIGPTYGPASRIDVVDGDNLAGGTIGSLAAIAGYPHLTVPMGEVMGLPVGLSFVGRAWTDASLLALGAAYERASHARRAPRYLPSVESGARIEKLFAPPGPRNFRTTVSHV